MDVHAYIHKYMMLDMRTVFRWVTCHLCLPGPPLSIHFPIPTLPAAVVQNVEELDGRIVGLSLSANEFLK
jgi:hypothetical protein